MAVGVVDGVFADVTEQVLARHPEDEQAGMLHAPGPSCRMGSATGAYRYDLRGRPARHMIGRC